MTDYRFDFLAYGLRKENPLDYAFSVEASQLLADNDETSLAYGDELWEEFWQDLIIEFSTRESTCD